MVEFHIRGGEDAIADEIKRLAGQPKAAREIGDAVHKLVEKGRSYAESISPVDSGEFRESWEVQDFAPRREGDSPMSQLQNTDPAAVSIEYGTKDTPPHAVLASTQTYLEQIAGDEDIHI
jgi:hypothetical protein